MQYEEQEKEGMWQIWRTVLMFNKKMEKYSIWISIDTTVLENFLTDQS